MQEVYCVLLLKSPILREAGDLVMQGGRSTESPLEKL
jgi:hypothetical protein